jgi:hypothetical protein
MSAQHFEGPSAAASVSNQHRCRETHRELPQRNASKVIAFAECAGIVEQNWFWGPHMFRLQRTATLIVCLLMTPVAWASNISFTGSFTHDTDLQYFTFTLAHPTTGVALRTWSYAGGTNAAGHVIPTGGFEPVLNLYMADGTQMNPGISGPCTIPPTGNPVADLLPDPTSGACADVYYPTTLSFPAGTWMPGTYTVVLSTFANQGVGNLSDGFFANVVLGLPNPSNFTCQVGSPGVQGNPPTVPVDQPFCDEWGNNTQRTGAWALDFYNVDSASALGVPEPNTLPLMLAGLIVLIGAGVQAGRSRR